MTTLRFSAFLALLAAATCNASTSTPASAGSAGERALFGSSYAEDCLFGSSSHLFGAPKTAGKKTDESKNDSNDINAVVEAKVSSNASESPKGAAFVNNNNKNPSAFINHHPLYPAQPLN